MISNDDILIYYTPNIYQAINDGDGVDILEICSFLDILKYVSQYINTPEFGSIWKLYKNDIIKYKKYFIKIVIDIYLDIFIDLNTEIMLDDDGWLKVVLFLEIEIYNYLKHLKNLTDLEIINKMYKYISDDNELITFWSSQEISTLINIIKNKKENV